MLKKIKIGRTLHPFQLTTPTQTHTLHLKYFKSSPHARRPSSLLHIRCQQMLFHTWDKYSSHHDLEFTQNIIFTNAWYLVPLWNFTCDYQLKTCTLWLPESRLMWNWEQCQISCSSEIYFWHSSTVILSIEHSIDSITQVYTCKRSIFLPPSEIATPKSLI